MPRLRAGVLKVPLAGIAGAGVGWLLAGESGASYGVSGAIDSSGVG